MHNAWLYACDKSIGALQGLHLDGSFSSDWAVEFTHAAPDAQVALNMRAEDCHGDACNI
jgi:hypothetical protein